MADETTPPEGTPPEGTPPAAPNPADVVAGIVNPPEGTPPEGTPATWHYAEGVPGQGDIPDYFQSDRYKTLSDQAMGYKELETKFGSFTGTPKEGYEINISEDLTNNGISIDKEDPLYEDAVKFAEGANMNQEGFDNMMDLYAMSKLAEHNANEQFKTDEIESLGADGQVRINNLLAWGKANLSTELYEGFEDMPQSASAVKALEQIITMTQGAAITPTNLNGGEGGMSDAELNAMQFEKDEHGNRRLNTDKAFAADFHAKMKQRHGSQDHNIIVGAPK